MLVIIHFPLINCDNNSTIVWYIGISGASFNEMYVSAGSDADLRVMMRGVVVVVDFGEVIDISGRIGSNVVAVVGPSTFTAVATSPEAEAGQLPPPSFVLVLEDEESFTAAAAVAQVALNSTGLTRGVA